VALDGVRLFVPKICRARYALQSILLNTYILILPPIGFGDVVVAGLVAVVIVVSLLSVIPLTTYVRSYGKVLVVSLIVLVICVLVASFKQPYDLDHPQRLNVAHLYRPDDNSKLNISILIDLLKLYNSRMITNENILYLILWLKFWCPNFIFYF